MLGEERRADHEGALTEPASSRLVSPDIRDEFGLETIDMNMGPQHPAMHGLLRLILELDGETVVRCDPVMGYLHRCQEKIAENRMYPAVIPLTDRLDYFANMHNEHGYVPRRRGPARRGDTTEGRVHPRPHVRAHAAREPHPIHRLPHAGARGLHPDPLRFQGAGADTDHLRGRDGRADDVPLHHGSGASRRTFRQTYRRRSGTTSRAWRTTSSGTSSTLSRGTRSSSPAPATSGR